MNKPFYATDYRRPNEFARRFLPLFFGNLLRGDELIEPRLFFGRQT
jgi:hypothetical protein